MIVCAHPDDAEISAGGILARYAHNGHHAIIVNLTKGEAGQGKEIDPNLEKIRVKEAKKAAEILGCEVIFMNFKDTEVEHTRNSVLELSTIIRKYKPDILLSHSVLDANPDHRVAAYLTSDARLFAKLPSIGLGEEPHSVPTRYVFPPVIREMQDSNLFCSDTFVDITKFYRKKIDALRQHQSQLKHNPHFLDIVEARARYFGIQIDVKYAESFKAETKINFDLLPTKK